MRKLRSISRIYPYFSLILKLLGNTHLLKAISTTEIKFKEHLKDIEFLNVGEKDFI